MITELVLLLGFLAFACVRTECVRRPWAFFAAIIAWGGARLLTEINFSGTEYSYGSWVSYGAAGSLVLCLIFLFLGCSSSTSRNRSHTPAVPGTGSNGEEDTADSAPSERIQHVLEKR